ncbi:MAG: response regulator transcription factor [Lachnospira sp.]|nr:response regulator transcription factor [Lachnospira sp.]
MDSYKVLVADDESRMRKLVHDFLARRGYIVLEAGDGQEALDLFYSDKEIALVILDVMMPKINGYDVCREIRQTSSIPVIILTAKGEEEDELTGFNCGADEYIAKPFSPRILTARVDALLRRSYPDNATDKPVTIGGITLDKTAHRVSVEGQDVELSFKEFELLEYFMKNNGVALSREKILNNVWNYDYYGDARTIDTHVKKLRHKLGPCGDYIQTIWGMGYKFTPASR